MKCIVTGGGGFVGKALCFRLAELGHEVIGVSRRKYSELEEREVRSETLDISDADDRGWNLFEGADVVFHVAAKVDMWGPREAFWKINVEGSRNVVEACRRFSVSRIVYTSSPSVVADGKDLLGIDESYPYPKHFEAFYPWTKSIAEQETLAASDESLAVCALRPHLIWGPGDNNFVPTILERAAAGRLMQVGDGKNRTDLSYIEDCVEAHVLAARGLEERKEEVSGEAFFISQGEPVLMWDWINEVLKRNGQEPISRKVPAGLAAVLAGVFEFFARNLPGEREPLLTKFLVTEMHTSHYFSIDKAKRLLGYEPKYSIAEAMEKTFGSGEANFSRAA